MINNRVVAVSKEPFREKVHELRLPFDAPHPVLFSVAASTALSLAEARNEQRLRSLEASDRPT
jgi:hypothetical protein